MTDKELMQQALDALLICIPDYDRQAKRVVELQRQHMDAITALRARLAQPEPKPVAYRVWSRMGGISFRQTKPSEDEYVEWDALYATSPHHEWVWLTDEEIFEIWMKSPAETEDRFAFVKAVIAKLREKNG